MAMFDDGAIDVLMSAVGRETESADENVIYQDERFLFWLANDLRSGLDHEQRSRDQREAIEFARRALPRLKGRLAGGGCGVTFGARGPGGEPRTVRDHSRSRRCRRRGKRAMGRAVRSLAGAARR